MPCSFCQQPGHNIRTCGALLEFREEEKQGRLHKKKYKKLNKELEEENKVLWENNREVWENNREVWELFNKAKKKLDKHDKTIRRLRKSITQKNRSSSQSISNLACKVAELKQALKDSKRASCNDTEELTCSICYDDIISKNNNFTKTECGHCFHTKCLMIWVGRRKKNSCPICRQSVY